MKIKKTALVLCISATVLLCGCGSRPDAPATGAPDIFQGSGTFSKAQKKPALFSLPRKKPENRGSQKRTSGCRLYVK